MWDSTEIAAIAAADDLHIAPFRPNGRSYGTLTWIWSVVVNGRLFVRAYNGASSRWFKAALSQKAGRVTVAGMTKEVAFLQERDDILNANIDDAYRKKYATSRYLGHMIGGTARAATIEILPRH